MKINFPKFGYEVRSAQLITQYGVGAMTDFPDHTFMLATPSKWGKKSYRQIHDPRLEKRLGVNFLGQPVGEASNQAATDDYRIAFVRFPGWYRCTHCKCFKTMDEWLDIYRSNHPDAADEMIGHMKCPSCGRGKLSVTRFVTVCSAGHISDFPWRAWLTYKGVGGNVTCPHKELELVDKNNGSSGLDAVVIRCKDKDCGRHADMGDAFQPDVFQRIIEKNSEASVILRCPGNHHWDLKGDSNCNEPRKVVLRGSSSVYFPKVISSLTIPGFADNLTELIQNTHAYQNGYLAALMTVREIGVDPSAVDNLWAPRIAQEIADAMGDVDAGAIQDILGRLRSGPAEIRIDDIAFKHQEYDVLNGSQDAAIVGGRAIKDFRKEKTNNSVCGLEQVVLVSRLREVMALVGYTRILPEGAVLEGGGDDGAAQRPSRLVDLKTHNEENGKDWYLGCESRGEGIFVQFDSTALKEWYESNKDSIDERLGHMRNHCANSFFGANKLTKTTAEFVLLHTISHLFMKQLSFECGYNVASLKERIYCDRALEPDGMAGFLVYTAAGDSEGSLGGLVRQGREDLFKNIFRKAIESAVFCSNDPVCSLSKGQGTDGMNLAACYACALLPETSCEEMNSLLDRALVVGSIDNRNLGFYSPQLFNGDTWDGKDKTKTVSSPNVVDEDVHDDAGGPVEVVGGTDVGDAQTYTEILEDIKTCLEDDSPSKDFIDGMIARAAELTNAERPCRDARCGDSSVDLVWRNLKIVVCSEDSQEAYGILSGEHSGWTAFYMPDGKSDELVDMLKGGVE